MVTDDQHRELDRTMNEIKRQLNQPGGSPLDPDLVARRLRIIVEAPTAAPTGSTTPEQAVAVMEAACYDAHALASYLGIRLSAIERARLAAVPFSEEVLLDSRSTHVLAALACRS